MLVDNEDRVVERVAPRPSGIVVALQLVLAVYLIVPGIPLTVLWFTNLGPVYWWHLAGPVALVAGVALAARVVRRVR